MKTSVLKYYHERLLGHFAGTGDPNCGIYRNGRSLLNVSRDTAIEFICVGFYDSSAGD
jgi:hypothetical protein